MALTSRRFWAITSLFVILHVIIFDLRIITSPETLQVQYVPDDAYYYLTLARNFATKGLWTFDSGISTATGFHPLLAYLLSFLYKVLQPTIEEFVLYGIALSSLVTLAVSLVVWGFGVRHSNPYFLIFLALLASSTNYTYNSVSIMEWPLVVFFASIYIICFYRTYSLSPRTASSTLFIIGLFGSLSRSDFGLLPLSIFVASFVLYRISKHLSENCAAGQTCRDPTLVSTSTTDASPNSRIGSKSKGVILASFSGLFGASLGVLLFFVHNYIFSGHFLQVSAKMKAYWGQIHGISYGRVIRLIFSVVGVNYSFVLVALAVLLFAILVWFIVPNSTNNKRVLSGFCSHAGIRERFLELTLVISVGLCVVGYLFLYARITPIQPWYSGNLIVPLFVILVIVTSYIDNAIQDNYRKSIKLGISIIVLGIVAHNTLVIDRDLSNSPWPHQQSMLEAGKYLRQHPLDGRIASWNAGIIGYYQGGHVINIDGLVNDDIYAYAVNNRLPVYLLQKNVRYIIDFEKMLSSRARRLRGGYNDEVFLNSLQQIKVFDNGQYGWKHLTLYRLSP